MSAESATNNINKAESDEAVDHLEDGQPPAATSKKRILGAESCHGVTP